MTNPFIFIKTESELEKKVLSDYWALDATYRYKYHFTEVLTRNNTFTHQAIQQLAKEHSTIMIACECCGNLIVWANNRYAAQGFWNFQILGTFYCKTCNSMDDTETRETLKKMEIALHSEQWKRLDLEHLRILTQLAQLFEKIEIYAKIFNGDPYDRTIWEKVNLLERLGLIWIKRNKELRSVINFEMHGQLRKRLGEDYPQYFPPTKKVEIVESSSYEVNPVMSVILKIQSDDTLIGHKATVRLHEIIVLPKDSILSIEADFKDEGVQIHLNSLVERTPEGIVVQSLANNNI